ncbi:putative disease resistance RPP13-like protein 3 [Macadamia integrifolia]|uniref:putative disease resistance RPP13-like protein 3 n=1 Tax=Macadamia integrifolia TaxID=60698 RepID=UPI001C4F996F|nr:putative disease resistance RPP13-like protein 3 [Macadamia integrifolia]
MEVAYLANSDGSPHRLWVLSAADSWELFIRKVFGAPSEVSSTDTSTSATTITTTTSDAMKYLRIPPHLEVIGRKMGLPCLLELFPNEIEIPTRRFILSWAAEGLFFGQHYGELADEEVADDCLQQLLHFDVIRTVKVSSNGNAKTCSIPCDLPKHRVLSTNIARNSSHDDHRCVWFHYPEQSHSHQPPENPEHATHSDDHPDHDHGNANFCKTLFSLWCFNFPGGYEAGQKVGLFLGRCISEGGLKFLGVLDLEGVFRPCLPEEIGELINLRYLGLRETYLETLPSNVGKLVNLQTLDTKHTYVRNYHRFIQKLKKLRHLHLNEGQHSSELVSRLNHLSDLRTLSGIVVEEFDLFYLLRRLTKLRKLRFTCQLNPQRKAGTIKFLEQLEQLRSLKVPSVVQRSLQNAKQDDVEQKLVKDLEGIVRDAKAAIVNHALSLTAHKRREGRERKGKRRDTLFTRCAFRKRVETLFKRYGFSKRVETLFTKCGFHKSDARCKLESQKSMESEIHELHCKLAKLSSNFSRDYEAGETSQGNPNKVAAGEEESSSHPQGKQLSDWIRSSADYDEREEDIIIGLKHDMELLKTRLLDKKKNHLWVISVFGIQGIGKTVLAWEVYKSSDVDNHFPCKAWVCPSAVGNHDKGVILKKIGKQVMRLQEDQETTDDGHEGGLQKRLCEFLRAKKYLIVIDDAPGTKVWNDLKEAFPDGQNGSRIMLTTRDVECAYLANSDGFPHQLWVLSAADSWELFTRKVFIAPWQVSTDVYTSTTSHTMKSRIPPQLEAIGRKVVKKCKGIPLFIVELADLVSSIPTSVSEWSSVLHGADMCLIEDDAHRCFYRSGFLCQMISSSHVKQVLPFLCGLFPTKIEIPARRFILSWAAEGLFFGQRYGEVAEEEVADYCLQQLLHFDIIRTEKVGSNGNAKTCSIPHDLPMSRVLRLNNAPDISCDDDHRCVWFHDLDTNHPHPPENSTNDHDNQQQQTVWCFNFPAGYRPGQFVGRFLQRGISKEGGLQFLGVLDLEGVDKPCLPEEIGELINLRYLGLRETYLDTLPSSVGNLLKLQTLDTKCTSIRNYPESIQKLKKLQHLHLNEGQYSNELVSWLSHLSDLRTLSGVVIDELDLVKKDHGLCRLTNLRKLRFACQFNQQPRKEKVQGHWLDGLEHLRSLKVNAKNQTIADLEFVTKNQELTNLYLLGRLNGLQFDLHNKLPENLTTLTLSGSELTGDPMPKLEKLPKLQFLRLCSKSFKGQNMVCSSGGFSQLRVLRIWKLEELQEWSVEEGAMPNIEELKIRTCNNLKKLSRVPKTLNELKLTKMPEEFTKKFVKYKVCRVVKD